MMIKQTEEALRMAIEAMEFEVGGEPLPTLMIEALNACKAALQEDALERMAENAMELGLEWELFGNSEQLDEMQKITEQEYYEQEPVAWMYEIPSILEGWHNVEYKSEYVKNMPEGTKIIPLYTRPTKPLSDDEIVLLQAKYDIDSGLTIHSVKDFARAIEKAHGIGESDE
jgi:hypothetical protein